MKRILFVCLGNICRSSSAEEVMRTLIKKKGLEHEIEVDSAGILSYHRQLEDFVGLKQNCVRKILLLQLGMMIYCL